jgi:hypothetical protein
MIKNNRHTLQLAQTITLEAKFSMRRVLLSDGIETQEMTFRMVKVNTICKYKSPTFGLSKLDYTYHKKYI